MTSESVKGRKGSGAYAFAFVALLCAGAAALVAVQMTRGFKQEKKLPVVVAKREISAGERLTREMVEVAMWPEKRVPSGAVSSLKTLFADEDKPPIAATGILANEAIVRPRLADPSKGTALAALVRPGYRAVAVKMDNNVVRAGLIYPGAQVDVVGTLRDTKTHNMATRILVVNVRVLAVEQHTDVETFRPRAQQNEKRTQEKRDAVVTIELTPEQSELVFLAGREGTVDLALRNGEDDLEVMTPGATPDMIMSARQWTAPEAEPIEQPGVAPSPEHAKEPPKKRAGRRRPPVVHRTAAEAIAADRPSAEPTVIETYDAKRRKQ